MSKHSVYGYILTGILTVIPIWFTWLVFNFLFTQMSRIGTPLVQGLAKNFQESSPSLAKWILALDPLFQSIIAVVITLVALYLLGFMATLVIGKRLIAAFDSLINHVPFVQTIYGSTKKLLSALQQQPNDIQRVVLIDFPSAPMKAVGFVTQTFVDAETGQKTVAVYVPTTPNPTSGYLELVPFEKVTSTHWTMDEAMTFIISGGAVAPKNLQSENSNKV
jgi:uncharacterized membrane protein